jgi:hypothetical protein
MALTRKEAENLVWSRTHRDYKGIVAGHRCALILRNGGTQSVPLSQWTDAELADHLPKFSSFEAAKATRDEINARCKRACERLNTIPGVGTGPMGLTPDEIKFSAEYKEAKREADREFARVREFNDWFTKAYREELAEERKVKRG